MTPFSPFYLRFMDGETNERFWSDNFQGGRVHAREGYAFEIVCLLHIAQIRQALGIPGVACDVSAWRSRHSDPGAQVDLVVDRADGIINLCEMEFGRKPFEIDKSYDGVPRNKMASFAGETGTRKALRMTLVSPFGVRRNAYWQDLQSFVSADDLFAETWSI